MIMHRCASLYNLHGITHNILRISLFIQIRFVADIKDASQNLELRVRDVAISITREYSQNYVVQ